LLPSKITSVHKVPLVCVVQRISCRWSRR